MKSLRAIGIAIGSLTAAWLCLWLVGGWLLGSTGGGVIATLAAVVLDRAARLGSIILPHDPTG